MSLNIFPQDDEMVKTLNKVVYIVEATSAEQSFLWNQFAKEGEQFWTSKFSRSRVDWQQDNCGWLPTIGTFVRRPVTLQLTFATINGHNVLFYYSPSQMVDHVLINRWLRQQMPQIFTESDGGRKRATDADNFHLCVHYIDRLNEAAKKVDVVVS